MLAARRLEDVDRLRRVAPEHGLGGRHSVRRRGVLGRDSARLLSSPSSYIPQVQMSRQSCLCQGFLVSAPQNPASPRFLQMEPMPLSQTESAGDGRSSGSLKAGFSPGVRVQHLQTNTVKEPQLTEIIHPYGGHTQVAEIQGMSHHSAVLVRRLGVYV